MVVAADWKLSCAACNRNVKAIKEQVSKGADTNQKDINGHTLLMGAAIHNYVDVARCLVEEVHMPIDVCDMRGWTALMFAAANGNLEVVQYLVSAGADIHTRSAAGETVLHVAARTESVKSFSFLQESGADVESQDMLGRTALHNAADFAYPNMVQFILKGGWLPVDCKDKFGQTPLMLTAGFPRNESESTIQTVWQDLRDGSLNKAMTFLLNAGADPSVKDVLGRTALHRALINRINFVYLLKRCPDFPHLVDKKQQTPIMTALILYDDYYQIPSTIKLLLIAGTDPNIEDANGKTALYFAAERDKYSIINSLLKAGAKTSSCVKETLTQILHIAARHVDHTLVRKILQGGADVNDRRKPIFTSAEEEKDVHRCMLNYGGSSFMNVDFSGQSPIFEALRLKQMVRHLISAGADVNFKDFHHITPLMAAIFLNVSAEVLRMLLKAGADPAAENVCGVTLLHCMAGRLTCVKENKEYLRVCDMVMKSADIVNAVDHDGRTPLHYVAVEEEWKKDHVLFFEMLVRRGANVDATDINGKTPLHYAAREGNVQCMEMLISAGAALKTVDIYNVIPLPAPTYYNYISKCNYWEIIKLLVKNGADVVARDKDGRTALHQAAELGDITAVRYLTHSYKIEWGCDNEGNSILHSAIKGSETARIHECMKRILETTLVAVDDKNAKGQTALSTVVQMVTYKRNTKTEVEILLKEGANPNAVDNVCKTALHYAVTSKNFEAVELLMAAGADVSVRDASGQLPLHCAAKVGFLKVLQLLVRLGYRKSLTVDERDSEGRTALMHAVDSRDAVNFFLRRRADVNAKDNSGRTALQAAVECGNFHSSKLLWASGGDFSSIPQTSLIRAAHLAAGGDDLQLFEHVISFGLSLSDFWWDPEHKATLLHSAAKSSHDMLKYLSKLAQTTEEQDENGHTALHCAVNSSNVVGTRYLLEEANANVDARDRHGSTALMLVVDTLDRTEQVEMSHILLEAGADMDIQDQKGLTAYQKAQACRNYDYCLLLDYMKYRRLLENAT